MAKGGEDNAESGDGLGEAATPHYLGHRERARQRFLHLGENNIEDYELLELILQIILPRRDTKPLAKALLKEFDAYKSFSGRKIKESRLEVLRAGFRDAWAAKDYKTIIGIANKLPEETLQEDEKLLTLYDLALTRTEDGI